MNPQDEIKKSQPEPLSTEPLPVKNSNAKLGDDFFIRPLRTYEDDVKNAVQRDSVSTAKILMAEQQRRQIEEEEIEQTSPTSKTNTIKIGLSILFVLIGLGAVGAGYYFYYQKTNTVPTTQNPVAAPINIIDVEEVVNIETNFKTKREVLAEIRNILRSSDNLKEGTLKEITLSKTVVTTDEGREIKTDFHLTIEEFLNILEAREPDALIRALERDFLMGVHKTKTSAEPFILLKVSDYDIAYSKMLDWERILITDIQDYFFKNLGSSQVFIEYENGDTANETGNSSNTNASPATTSFSTTTTTSTTTSEVSTSTVSTTTTSLESSNNTQAAELSYDPQNFKDLVLANKDTRSISADNGKLLFFYSFIDREHILMTTNIETLNIILNRINTNQLVR